MPIRAVLGSLLLLLVPAAPASAQELTGFRSVLAQGQGTTATAEDLARNRASGETPPEFVNQQPLYAGLSTAFRTFGPQDLDTYFKTLDFGTLPGGQARVDTPRPGVTIVRDARFAVPRITGQTRADVMFGSGYAHAQDRLFLMDVLRRTARGSLSELVGPSGAEDDARQLTQQDFSAEELEAQVDNLDDKHGAEGAAAQSDLREYVAGINQFIDEVRGDPNREPVEYAALGTTPERWTLADSAATGTLLVSQFNVLGVGERANAIVHEALRRRLGTDRRARAVFRDLRQLEDPEAPTTAWRPFRFDATGRRDARASAIFDKGSVEPRDAIVGQAPAPGTVPPFVEGILGIGRGGALPRMKSNAVLVSGRHTKSGRPIASMGPQVGYFSPQILMEVELHGGGIDVAGVVFPGAAPYVLIGHTKHFAWSGTTAMSDLGDVFVERLCDPRGRGVEDPAKATHYLHRGRCVPFTTREQVLTTPAAPSSPGSTPQRITLRTLRSVHGPVTHFAEVGGDPVALTQQKTVDFRELDSLLGFARLALNEPEDAEGFRRAWRDYPGAENWFYVSDREISFVLSGSVPRRARGTDPDLPTWGTGEWDWRGFDPVKHTFRDLGYDRTPRSREPRSGYIISWNNKEARGWHAPSDVWTLSDSHRSQLLERRLLAERRRAGGKLDLPTLVRLTQEAHLADLEIQEVYPLLKRVIGPRVPEDVRPLLALLDGWRSRGGARLDLDEDGRYEDGPAIRLMREWTPLVSRRVFEPVLGSEVVRLLDQEGLLSLRPGRSEYGGWHGQLRKDLRRALGRRFPARLRRAYCGRGSRSRCRSIVLATLRDAARNLETEFEGGPDAWQLPVEMTPITTAGAIPTPTFPLQNRGTYHQVVELSRK